MPRLAAYRRSGRTVIPVKFWTGTVVEAIAETASCNSKISLPLTSVDRTEAAWRLNLLTDLSKAEIVQKTGVGTTTIAQQRLAKTELAKSDKNPALYPSWKKARWAWSQLGNEDREYVEKEQEHPEVTGERWAKQMVQNLPRDYHKMPTALAHAFHNLMGRQACAVMDDLSEIAGDDDEEAEGWEMEPNHDF